MVKSENVKTVLSIESANSSFPEAVAKVKALALRVLADRLEHGEAIPELVDVFSVPA